jgi:drug/metabolite transporter (DMT)-like permease
VAQSEVLAGFAAAAAAAACFDGAVLLQAADARKVPQEHGLRLGLLRRLVTRPRWVGGTVVGILGWPLQLVAFALAPVTVVQPTLALGMLLLLAGGSRMLGEHVGRREWAAAAAVVAGIAVITIAHPPHTDQVPSLRTALPLLGLVALIGLPFALGNRRSTAWTLIVAAGCAFALTALTGKLLTVQLAAAHIWAALAWAAATALCAGAGFLVDMTALQRFDATRVAPPMFVLETVIPVAAAPWLFGERWGETPAGGLLLAAGLLLVLAGGWVLGSSRPVRRIEGTGGAPNQREDPIGGGRALAVPEVRPPR